MGDANWHRERGLAFIQQAIEKDDAKEYETAMSLYTEGLGILIAANKFERNPATKAVVEQRCEQYMKRAEKLKQYLSGCAAAAAAPKRKAIAAGDGGGDGTETSETERLRDHQFKDDAWERIIGFKHAKARLLAGWAAAQAGEHTAPLLLHGCAGVGKTHLCKALALSHAQPESTRRVVVLEMRSAIDMRTVFEEARAKAEGKPGVLLIVDELEFLHPGYDGGVCRVDPHLATALANELAIQLENSCCRRSQCDSGFPGSPGLMILCATQLTEPLATAKILAHFDVVALKQPSAEECSAQLMLDMGSGRHRLSQADFEEAGRLIEGKCSRADVRVLAQQTLMNPLRDVQAATHFRKVVGSLSAVGVARHDADLDSAGACAGLSLRGGNSTDCGTVDTVQGSTNSTVRWSPCGADDDGAEAMSLRSIPADELDPACMVVVRCHLEAALRQLKHG